MVNKEVCPDEIQTVEEMFGEIVTCPRCIMPLTEYYKKTRRKTKRGNDQERFTCLKCGYCFTKRDLGFGMRHTENEIRHFLELIKKGHTCHYIAKHGLMDISKRTLQKWRNKFKAYI